MKHWDVVKTQIENREDSWLDVEVVLKRQAEHIPTANQEQFLKFLAAGIWDLSVSCNRIQQKKKPNRRHQAIKAWLKANDELDRHDRIELMKIDPDTYEKQLAWGHSMLSTPLKGRNASSMITKELEEKITYLLKQHGFFDKPELWNNAKVILTTVINYLEIENKDPCSAMPPRPE